jgi:hypothetical protein
MPKRRIALFDRPTRGDMTGRSPRLRSALLECSRPQRTSNARAQAQDFLEVFALPYPKRPKSDLTRSSSPRLGVTKRGFGALA